MARKSNKEIEQEANQAVWRNLPVKCWYPSPEELPDVIGEMEASYGQ